MGETRESEISSDRGDMVSVGGECPNGIHTVDLNSDSRLLSQRQI